MHDVYSIHFIIKLMTKHSLIFLTCFSNDLFTVQTELLVQMVGACVEQ